MNNPPGGSGVNSFLHHFADRVSTMVETKRKEDLKDQIILRVTPRELEQLWHTAFHCFYWEQEDRFSCLEDEETVLMKEFVDQKHTFYFCDLIINAIIIKNSLRQRNFLAVILSDECDNGGYVVASSELWAVAFPECAINPKTVIN
jgi:hypothetical protein